VDDFRLWEVTPGGGHAARRLVVLARPDEDARLSRFTWSAGDVALPPLGRYLMHAAKLRHQARVRGDGRELTRVRDRTAARLNRLTDLLRDPAAAAQAGETAAALAADEASLAATLEALRQMRRSVEIARANMAAALPSLLPADFALADWLTQQLVDDADYLEATRERAERMREIVGRPPSPVPPAPPLRAATRAVPAPPRDTRVEQRLGFGVDVVDYSSRTTPQQAVVQQRLAGIVERVLQGVGLRLHDTDRQDAGDGMMVVLPPGLELHSVLPGLLHGWRAQVVADNGTHRDDRIRLRLSVAAGPFAHSAIGFTGATIIEMGRLLDSKALRRAVVEHADADLVALVSDRLHADVVGEGYPGLDAGQFEQLLVEVKSYRKQAWLWAGGAAAAIPPVPTAAATNSPGRRDVFVIHGRDEQARRALWGFLQAIDLHPLDWEEIVARTGEPTPFVRTVLDQAFAENQAAVVLITPDDHLAPHPGLRDPGRDAHEPVGQAAPNVLLQAGMALALQRDRTVVIEIGKSRPVSDLAGLDVIRFNGNADSLHRIAQRLRNAGCAVNTDGSDWLELGRFDGLDA
jgi:predicted nucleotide-binding protein